MSERRGLKRRHLIYYLSVFEATTDELLGYLVDITPDGFMIMSENPPEVDRIYQVKVRLSTGKRPDKFLLLKAKSLWTRRDKSAEYYDTGFQIQNPDADTRLQIELLIKELGFRN